MKYNRKLKLISFLLILVLSFSITPSLSGFSYASEANGGTLTENGDLPLTIPAAGESVESNTDSTYVSAFPTDTPIQIDANSETDSTTDADTYLVAGEVTSLRVSDITTRLASGSNNSFDEPEIESACCSFPFNVTKKGTCHNIV